MVISFHQHRRNKRRKEMRKEPDRGREIGISFFRVLGRKDAEVDVMVELT